MFQQTHRLLRKQLILLGKSWMQRLKSRDYLQSHCFHRSRELGNINRTSSVIAAALRCVDATLKAPLWSSVLPSLGSFRSDPWNRAYMMLCGERKQSRCSQGSWLAVHQLTHMQCLVEHLQFNGRLANSYASLTRNPPPLLVLVCSLGQTVKSVSSCCVPKTAGASYRSLSHQNRKENH